MKYSSRNNFFFKYNTLISVAIQDSWTFSIMIQRFGSFTWLHERVRIKLQHSNLILHLKGLFS